MLGPYPTKHSFQQLRFSRRRVLYFNHRARLPQSLKLNVKEKSARTSHLSEIVVSDFYEVQRTILPNQFFFKDKIDLLRENEELDKPLSVYCTGKIISKDNKQSFVEYDNFIKEIEVVENIRIRTLSSSVNADNLTIKWINVTQLLNLAKNNEMNSVNFLNKFSFSDLLNEVFNQQNNYLELLAIESIKHDVFLLGKPEDLVLAKEVLLLKIFTKVKR